MITEIDRSFAATVTATATAGPQTGAGFDAALKAAQKKAAADQAHAATMQEIQEKGLTDWVRDTRMEALKAKLREKVMAAMGLDEDSMKNMDDVIRRILEQKIQEEVEKQLQQAMQDENGDPAGSGIMQQAAAQPGNNDRSGKNCPLIPALAHPGAASLF